MSFIYSLNDTWNNNAIVFKSIFMNTSNGSGGPPVFAAGSKYIDLQSNGTSIFNVDATSGQVQLNVAYAVGAPALSMAGQLTTGISWSGNGLFFSANGASVAAINSTNLIVSSTGQLGFSSAAADTQPLDTILTRKAAANFRFGAVDVAAPVAQTMSVQSVVAGNANTAGANWTMIGSLSNGSGGGDIIIQTTLSTAASGTQNTAATALTLKGGSQMGLFAGAWGSSAPNTQAGTSYTMVNADSSIIFTNAAAVTVTLQAPASFTGHWLHIKQTGAGAVSSASANVVPLGGGAAGTAITTAAGKFAVMQSDGTNWIVMFSN